jgi:hypothetical protein
MKRLPALLALSGALLLNSSLSAQEREIQRALVERDQMSAEFAARANGVAPQALSDLHARQLRDVMAIPVSPEKRPYQRARMADERVLLLSPPTRKSGSEPDLRKSGSAPDFNAPLPLPGGPRGGVDPVLPQGFPG